MKCIIAYVNLVFLISLLFIQCNPQADWPVLEGPYLGQKPPGETPALFAPGIVSTGLDELNSVFSSDSKEFYFSVRNSSGAVSIFMTKIENDTWSGPKLVPFASRFGDIDVTISPDGGKIFFSSKRPIPGEDTPKEDNDFWMAKRVGDTWGDPIYLGKEINSDRDDYYPLMTNNGTIYFSSQREGPGTNNIYRSKLIDGKYTKAEKLGSAINTEHREFDPYVSPDETLLIFSSSRPGGFGADDLYISFKNKEGIWLKAKNMGNIINTSGSEYCPMITPDGKYLFFTSAGREDRRIPDRPLTYIDFEIYHNSPKNRYSDIYWMDVSLIEKLK